MSARSATVAVLREFKDSIRILLKDGTVTFMTVLTLAVGIGAATAIFTVVNAVLLKPLPFPSPERLVRITSDFQGRGTRDVGVSVAEYLDYRDRLGIFEHVSGLFAIDANLTGADRPERLEVQLVSANFFQVLGVDAAVGRVFGPQDYTPGNGPLAVISDGLWRRRFGGTPDAIGRALRLDTDLYTIVGVMPPTFDHPGSGIRGGTELWIHSGYVDSPFPTTPVRDAYVLGGALGRLRPGVTLTEARARLDAFADRIRSEQAQAYPRSAGWAPRMIPLSEDVVGNVRPAILILMVSVALLLLIACANIANLMMLRATRRQVEILIRRAMGAGDAHLVRLVLIETGLLAACGGGLGLLAAVWGKSALVSLAPPGVPRLDDVSLDGHVLLFTVAVTLVSALVIGVFPTLETVRRGPHVLREGNRATRAAGVRLQNGLVAVQIGMSLVLLVGAALLSRSLGEILRLDPGFRPANVLTAALWLPLPNDPSTGPYATPERRVQLYKRVLERLSALPGVQAVGAVSHLPLAVPRAPAGMEIDGMASERTAGTYAQVFDASPGYLEAMGVERVRGRDFSAADTSRTPGVVLVSESFARSFLAGREALGQRIRPTGRGPGPPGANPTPWLTVVAVVRDVKHDGLHAASLPQVYRCLWQSPGFGISFILRTTTAPGSLAEFVGKEVLSVDPDLPAFDVRTMEDVIARTVELRRLLLALVGAHAIAALLLAIMGTYGVMAYTVRQRTREFGVRLAVGAAGRDIMLSVLWQCARLACAGVTLGVACALVLTRLLTAFLFGVTPTDARTYAGVALALGAMALLASWAPAWRAARVDPIVVIRSE
ncbi:MAG TPA: ABC transporter permease [Vicinamibacterales bacterium]|nr:ABC transporter permease [Vicinamibacterales bacterium]